MRAAPAPAPAGRSQERDRPVVAAVDGSDTSYAAARWAADEAARCGAPLWLVAAVPWSTFLPIGLPHLGQEHGRDVVVRDAERRLAHAAEAAGHVLDRSLVRTRVLGGSAAEVLWEVSAGARLLVLGSRGRGGFTALVAGSVAVTAAATARCPVVVHREPGQQGGPVVVGLTDEPGAELEFAVEQAVRRNVPLVAVHGWFDEKLDPWTAELMARTARQAGAVDAAAARVDDALSPWRGARPGLVARSRVLLDTPSAALVGESSAAQLVVVGSRGRGAVSGMLLGSTSQAVLRHAHCPVAIARDADAS
ncbi:universal stress protein [Pseudonocardia spirodelae]|uniref:Universal stress protein n=1 Tax=Pseudonocardia spirodelae TaxID=3133431 RepID=A0ABU8T2I7_9PSEU